MLKTGEPKAIDLWLLPMPEDCTTLLADKRINLLLDTKEQQRFSRFKVDSKRQEFLASRLLLQHILRCRSSYSKSNISTIPDDMGRPFFYLGDEKIRLYFSLSHTKGFILCASSAIAEIGCDIEHVRMRKYLSELTKMVFSEPERRHYNSLLETERLHFFYKSWTLKEAYVKAMGQGLRIPLTSLSFTQQLHSTDSATICVAPDSGNKNSSSCWFFHTFCPASSYICSLATSISAPKLSFHHLLLEDGEIVEAKKG